MNWLIYSLLGMIIQGSILFLVKWFSFNTHPLIILLYQYLGSVIAMGGYLYLKKTGFKIKNKQTIFILLSGFLVSTGLSFYYLAIGLTNTSQVVPLHNVGITLLPIMLAYFFLKEKITMKTTIGITCSILCIILLTI